MALKLVLEKHKTGRKVYYVRGTIAGQRIRESTGFGPDRRAEADKVRVRLENDAIDRMGGGKKGNMLFAEAAALFLEAGRGDSHTLLDKIVEDMGDQRLGDIEPGHVRAMADRIIPRGKNSYKNRHAIAPFMAVFNFACENGWAHPIKVKPLKTAKVKRDHVDREWLDKFRAFCRHPGVRAMALVMFTTGARRSDCMRMHRTNFDLAARTVTVDTSKNGDAHTFLLTAEAAQELANLPYGDEAPNLFGVQYDDSIYKPWRAACKAAGIKYVPPHQAGRHSFATAMITEHGVDVATVADLANWKDRSLLLRKYVHPSKKRAAADLMEGKPGSTKLRVVGGKDGDK